MSNNAKKLKQFIRDLLKFTYNPNCSRNRVCFNIFNCVQNVLQISASVKHIYSYIYLNRIVLFKNKKKKIVARFFNSICVNNHTDKLHTKYLTINTIPLPSSN